MRGLGTLLDRFGNGTVRFTIDQNIVVPWVDRRSLPALFAALEPLGLARLDIHTAKDATSCPGAETCNLAVTGSRALASAISERLDQPGTEHLGALKSAIVKVSGCPNSCGQHHVADLGYHGGVKRVGDQAYPVYQLHLGGGVDARGARFGRQVVKIFARRVPEATVRLLALYDKDKQPDEPPALFFARVDAKRVQEALGALLTDPPTADDLLDIGEQKGFTVHTGEGECAA
jgi:sulfite reductase beta subunit-like hemoprotein